MLDSSRYDPAKLIWLSDSGECAPQSQASAVFVDLDDPQFTTPEFLLATATANEKVKVIGKLNEPDIDAAMRVAKLGVSEILTPDQCLDRLRESTDEAEVESDEKPASKYDTDTIIGSSAQMVAIRKNIDALCEVDFPNALILGETGTGKSLVSKILHHAGLRSEHNLVEVNCSAIPDELFESELFGHVKGSFTDAKTDKTGLFEYAEGGTLFLDEVGNLSQSAQAKLLKALEDRKLRRVGDLSERDINVRVVAATNLDLGKAIGDGRFRQDLFYRLNLLTIEVPPLRERPEDIPALIEYYLKHYCSIYCGKPDMTIDESAITRLQEYEWPGNIRELCNVIERAVLLTDGSLIKSSTILPAIKSSRVGLAERRQIILDIPPQGISMKLIEEEVVKQVLDLCKWNKSEAARFLAMSRPRLRRIIENAGLEQDRRRS